MLLRYCFAMTELLHSKSFRRRRKQALKIAARDDKMRADLIPYGSLGAPRGTLRSAPTNFALCQVF